MLRSVSSRSTRPLSLRANSVAASLPKESEKERALFQPTKVGDMQLAHRVVMSPLSRMRADKEHVHSDLAVTYYGQRASVPGTLIITESILLSLKTGGYDFMPGIWTDAQVKAWRKVTDAVHEAGSYIVAQFGTVGRVAILDVLLRDCGPNSYVSSGNVRLTGQDRDPRPLTIPEIKEYMDTYASAAKNAMTAGFDAVEIHAGNGYLVEQFIQPNANNRDDEYGGSIDNRLRFPLEVVDAVTSAIGAKCTGIRLSPWSTIQDMGMTDPIPTYSQLITQIRDRYPSFAYIHFIEPDAVPSSSAATTNAGTAPAPAQEQPLTHPEKSNDFARAIWGKRPFLSAGGHTRASALKFAEEKGDLVVFGKDFLANPDLPRRLKENLPLNPWDRSTFYTPESAKGYIDYPFYGKA